MDDKIWHKKRKYMRRQCSCFVGYLENCMGCLKPDRDNVNIIEKWKAYRQFFKILSLYG